MSSLPRIPLLGALAVGAVVAGTFACSATVGADPGTVSAAQRLTVVDVRVQETESGPKVDASARFVAVKEPGAPGDALELLGLAYRSQPVGACTLGDPAVTAPPAVRVDLRDLSPVTIELRGDEPSSSLLRLEPKPFPDVAGLVSGVVFVAPGALLPTPVRFATVHVGNGDVQDLELPDLPARLQLVDAVPLVSGGYAVDAAGLDVNVSAIAPTDRIAIDLVRNGVVRARCGADAVGHLHVDAATLGGAGDAVLVLRSQRHVQRDQGALGSLDARLERALDVKLVVR